MFSLTLGSGMRLTIMLQAVFRQSWVRICVYNFEKITFLGSGDERTDERTDRQKNANLGHPNISAFGAIISRMLLSGLKSRPLAKTSLKKSKSSYLERISALT